MQAKQTSKNFFFKRNQFPSILLPVVFFVLFDTIALTLNFWISYRLAENAVAVNLSGRQRMLSQRMTKAILSLANARNVEHKTDHKALTEFRYSFNLFDQTINSFWNGGETLGGDHKKLIIPPINNVDARTELTHGLTIWKSIKDQLTPIITHNKLGNKQIETAHQALQQHNLKLLTAMNALTLKLQHNSEQETQYLRWLQSAVLLLALINFFIVCKRLLINLRRSQNNSQALSAIIDSIDTAVLIYDQDKQILSANLTAEKMFEFAIEQMIGQPLSRYLLETGNANDKQALARNGRRFPVKTRNHQLIENDQLLNICTVFDISEQEAKEQRLIQLAFHDALTGLPNRLLLQERLHQEILHAKRNQEMIAVMFLDLDGFKSINDELGHDAGDDLLIAVGQRLKQCCREDDSVARIGGDEFVIILSSVRTLQSVCKIADNILKRVSQDFLIQDKAVHVGVSIGIAMYPDDHLEQALLCKYADQAMYAAKKQGKQRYCFYSGLN